ncbi:hypothetical protein [Litchfieldella qijiaojingensis]|uniref:hypothetical protein n=1 Tax=Litchfieldella qijiaojingensis TaxID=980347 RepID=UPI001679D277|nr:hypothetical protein [Halomonas qijiaojingensis]
MASFAPAFKRKTNQRFANSLNKSWKLEAGSWKLEAGSWKLEAGSWKLEAGSWKLEAGSWKLEAGRQHLATRSWYQEFFLQASSL